jgi:LPS-assembly lipoprotein
MMFTSAAGADARMVGQRRGRRVRASCAGCGPSPRRTSHTHCGASSASARHPAAPWPEHDPAALVEDEIELVVQVNGKKRGDVRVPREADREAIESLVLADPDVQKFVNGQAASPFANQLRRVVGTGTRTRVTNTPAEADATLQLIYELREREILSLSPEGRAREFQLRYRVAYQVLDRGKQVITPRTEIVLRRDYTFGDQEHLAREAEEVLLYRDMEHDAVHQLVRRLQARARS